MPSTVLLFAGQTLLSSIGTCVPQVPVHAIGLMTPCPCDHPHDVAAGRLYLVSYCRLLIRGAWLLLAAVVKPAAVCRQADGEAIATRGPLESICKGPWHIARLAPEYSVNAAVADSASKLQVFVLRSF